MDIKGNLDFYKEMIPSLSSSDWEYTNNPTFLDVCAWHPLVVSDYELSLDSRIGIQNTGANIRYFVEIRSGKGEYPTFVVSADLKVKPRPDFVELHFAAFELANKIIQENRTKWIENRTKWLSSIH